MSTLALPTAGPSRPSLALPSPLPANGLTLPTPLNAATGPNDAGPSNPTLARRQSGVGANATVGAGANGKNRSATPLVELKRSTSPDGHEEDEDDGDDDDDEAAAGTTKRKKGKASGGAAGGAGAGAKKATDGKGDYKYTSEISQMMFVFGEVQDPLPETVKLVEDIVRGQIIEIVTRARLLTHLRSARYLSAEDLIFLIRDDRGKVNRLRTYLSWKDVRKRAKEDEDGDVDPDEPDKAAPKGRKTMVKLPWELLTPFSDFLKTVPSKQSKMGPTVNDDDDDEDEDELQAHQDSMQRLKDADEITKKMTKDEYVHYSDCRQASFTYRKSRRFREFINFSAYLDARPNDDIIDILGFLSFEMVRSLCVTALEVRDRLEKSSSAPNPGTAPHPTKKVLTHSKLAKPLPSAHGQGSANSPAVLSSTSPIKRKLTLGEPSTASPHKRVRVDTPGGLVTSPEGDHSSLPRTPAAEGQSTHQTQPSGLFGHNNRKQSGPTAAPVSLFAKPPSARQPLLPSHMLEAFAQIQREEAANRVGSMRNWKGGAMSRGRVALV